MVANISTLGQALDQILRLKTQQSSLELLTTQIATGKKTQQFSGLDTDVLTSKRARAAVNSLDVYINNIDNANRRINLMQNSISELKAQAEIISNALVITPQQGDYPDLETIKDLADNIYVFIQELVNTQDGDRYLFAGADSTVRPVSDTGLYDSFLGEFLPDEADLDNPPLVTSGIVGDWGDGTITTDEFIAQYRNVNETVLGYSPSLTNDAAGKVFVRVDDTAELDYTVLADTQGMRDILIAVGVLRQMPPPEFAPGALNADIPFDDPDVDTLPEDTPPSPPSEKQQNFFQVINDLSRMIENAVDELNQEGFKIAQVQAQMSKIKDAHSFEKNTYLNTVAEVEDIDLTDAATKVNQLQIQLEASFRVTAIMSDLSLTRFI